MFLEALGAAMLGLALAWGAAYRLPHRLPSRGLVLSTGVAGALFGAFLTHTALGSGHFLVILMRRRDRLRRAAVASAAPRGRFRRRSATA